jgi:hypothetical protein
MTTNKLDCNCGRQPGKHTALSCGPELPREPLDKTPVRYRIVGDNSGHEYFIPVDRSGDWDKFMAIDEDDERSWDVPKYATRIDGRFTFTDPSCE